MLSKNQIKLINALRKKKNRQAEGLFVAEGIKVVEEFLQAGFDLHALFATEAYTNPFDIEKSSEISERELKQISALSNPNQVLAIFRIPEDPPASRKGLNLVLDSINDPGNLGTIIRLCDWFGVTQIICSTDTVDRYNPKVVQASMGSLSRIKMLYTDLPEYLSKEQRTIYGTFMNGRSIYEQSLEKDCVLILGNEANGISETVSELVDEQITIPQFNDHQQTESLNVAMATSILLSELRR